MVNVMYIFDTRENVKRTSTAIYRIGMKLLRHC